MSSRAGDLTSTSRNSGALLTFGEVHTGLLQHSTSLAQDHVAKILDRAVGERVRRFERPILYAVSPDQLTGVDCLLPSTSGRGTRCVGTVVGHAAITGGHVLQGSVYTRVVESTASQRQPWSHYLSRPGTLEIIGKSDLADVNRGFVKSAYRAGVLDLGAISARTVDDVQSSPWLNRCPPFRTRRTCMRWTVLPAKESDGEKAHASFRIDSDTMRTLELTVAMDDMPAVVELCEDLALHDWLLTTLVSLMESSLTGSGTRAERVERLRPAVDYLLHLWMPAARVDDSVASLWKSLELRPGFTRQWEASVNRIRDQVTLSSIALLEAAAAMAGK